MRKLVLFIVLLCSLEHFGHAQIFWTEGFGTGCNQAQVATAYTGPNGSWAISSTGTNDPEANEWFVSGTEAGMGAGICGDGCIADPLLDNQSLHLSNVELPAFGIAADNGAAYNSGGGCPGFFCVETSKRVESPVIDCSGQTGITLSFNYMEFGDGALDNAELWYNDGVTWTMLDDLAKTLCCGNVVCDGTIQGMWAAYSIALPASADNNPNVQIGFNWYNNDDGVGADPSFAVDDIELSGTSGSAITADFQANNTTICAGNFINFTDLSTGSPTSWEWDFPGGSPASSNSQNPSGIQYNTAGNFDVTLIAMNASDTDTVVFTNYISVMTCPTNANFTAAPTSICVGDTVCYTDLTTGNPTSWNWLFGGSASPTDTTIQNPCVVYNSAGSFGVTLLASGPNGVDDTTFSNYITVSNCIAPTASFVASDDTICEGASVDFTDQSIDDPTGWNWTFPGGTPGTSTAQNPAGIIYSTSGTYDVTLQVTNAYGTDDTTITAYIFVDTCIIPTADFSVNVDTICEGDSVNFTDLSTGGPTSWSWNFGGSATPATSTDQNPVDIAFSTQGWQSVTLTATNVNGSDSYTNTLAFYVQSCPLPVADFDASSINICEGDSVYFTDLSSDADNWEWIFPGGNPATSTNQNPGVLFSNPDTVTVTQVVTNTYGSDTITMEIIVNSCPPPVAGFTGPDTVCQGELVTFTDTSLNTITFWDWSFPGADPDSSYDQNPSNIQWNTPGIYDFTLVVYNNYGADSVNGIITVIPCNLPYPVINFTDSVICVGDTISFFGDGSTGNPELWDWYLGEHAIPISSVDTNVVDVTYTEPGIKNIKLTVYNQYGSQDTTISITVDPCYWPQASFSLSDTIICQGSCVSYASTSKYTDSYQWVFYGVDDSLIATDSSGIVCYDSAGVFAIQLVAYNEYGSDTLYDSAAVDVSAFPFLRVTNDTIIRVGTSVGLDAFSNQTVTYNWFPEDYLDCYECRSPVSTPLENMWYYVTISNQYGCAVMDSMFIEVEEKYFAGLPSAFSPNFDGKNDYLLVRGNGINRVNFMVYNRYGQKVFETSDPEQGWDGKHNGKDVNPGVFVYYLWVEWINGSNETMQGNVTLIR